MSALVATGRHAEALRVYDDFRRLLAEELGIAPSPALSAKQAELLGGIDVAPWKPTRRLPLAVTSLEGRTATMRGDHRLGRGPAPADTDRARRSRQDPAAHRDRSPPAGGAPRPPRRDVRAGGRQRGVRRRRRRRRARPSTAAPGKCWPNDWRRCWRRPRWCCCSTTASTSSTRSPIWSIVSWSPARTCRSSRRAASGCGWLASSCTRCRRCRRADDDGPAVRLFVERARAVMPQFDPDRRRAGEHRRDRPSSRRAAAGDRAGGGALAHARRGRGGGRAGPPLRAAVGRGTHLDAPWFVGGGGVVVLRAAR